MTEELLLQFDAPDEVIGEGQKPPEPLDEVSLLEDMDDSMLRVHAGALRKELVRLKRLINTPQTEDWLRAVPLEAAHQIERNGVCHDVGKTPLDWFWLIGYLAQKAADAQLRGDLEKAKHHTISTGAAMLNWFRYIVGDNKLMRPGIALPAGASDDSHGDENRSGERTGDGAVSHSVE